MQDSRYCTLLVATQLNFCRCERGKVELQGTLVSETRCLECKTVTTREEAFYDLSLDIEQNCSLTACLQNFRCLFIPSAAV